MRFLFFFLTFYVDLGFVTLSFCVCFIILSSLVAYSRNLNCKGWVCYWFYFWIKPPNNLFKPQIRTRKNRSLFYGRIGPYFLTLQFDFATTLDSNPPKPANCLPLNKILYFSGPNWTVKNLDKIEYINPFYILYSIGKW